MKNDLLYMGMYGCSRQPGLRTG
ncbi:MAG: hypothetical protein QOJ85_107, partial [Solirubrobacteraceae bacterium]|nr:hypothetical protein [Solirubrobacteraceae bacterium]